MKLSQSMVLRQRMKEVCTAPCSVEIWYTFKDYISLVWEFKVEKGKFKDRIYSCLLSYDESNHKKSIPDIDSAIEKAKHEIEKILNANTI